MGSSRRAAARAREVSSGSEELSITENSVDEGLCKKIPNRIPPVFCSGGPPDVRDALRSVQKQVLNGVTILFSGCFPKEDQSETEAVRQRSRISPLWKLAEKFGARCVLDPSDDVTHVVCQRPWTGKYKWARSLSTPKPTVSPGWLICSATLYRKADAEQFCV